MGGEVVPQDPLAKETEELGTLIEVHERIVEHKPYTPNRAQRRAMAKRDRALMKRNRRG